MNRTSYIVFTAFVIIYNIVILSPLHASFFYDDLHQLNMKDGLPDNIIVSIFQDSDGFMWFGSYNGLSKYDGMRVKNYNLENDRLVVSSIKETSDRKLWIVGNNALYCLDRQRDDFIPVTFKEKVQWGSLSDVQIVNDSLFWGIGDNRLLRMKRRNIRDGHGNLAKIEFDVEKAFSNLIGKQYEFLKLGMSVDRRYLYLVTNDARLLFFDTVSNHVTLNKKISYLKETAVTSIISVGEYIWISSIVGGVIRYHVPTQHLEQFLYDTDSKLSALSHTDAYDIVPISNRSYLAVTWNGYTTYTPDENNPSKIVPKIYNHTSFGQYRNLETRMISSFFDSNGVLWIGTRGGGVYYWDLKRRFYKQYSFDQPNEIRAQVSDCDNRIWLATFHKGIMRSDKPFTKGQPLSFSTIRAGAPVSCAMKDSHSDLWFGNIRGELICYKRDSKSFHVYPIVVSGEPLNVAVNSLFIDSRRRFWIGTKAGLFLFNSRTKEYKRVSLRASPEEREPSVSSICEDKKQNIWIGTDIGVLRLEGGDNRTLVVSRGYEEKAKVDARSVNALIVSSGGIIYVGYAKGFGIVFADMDQLSYFYTAKDGLCNDNISSIIEDAEGHIWLGNVSGISRYSNHKHLFYNYYISGNNRSVMLLDKTLFWGNNKSLTYFNPAMIASSFNNKVSFIGLEVNNKLINAGEKVNDQMVLTENISYTEEVQLEYMNRDFALLFSNLNYSEEQQKYAYRLYPYQREWLVTEARAVPYTNLSAGDYTFEVRVLYPDNQEGKVSSMHIVILPHWSQTFIFYFFVFLSISSGIGYVVYRMWCKQRRLKKLLELEHELFVVNMEREKEKQLRNERTNFFTRAAHELRTPLTLILSPLQGILSKLTSSDKLYEPLSIVYRNSLSLSTLVNHLLYVQKIEAGMVRLQLSEWDMAKIVRKQADFFKQMALVRECDFIVSLNVESASLCMDVEKMESAICNLLSNAFKYTPRKGRIELSLSRKEIEGKGFCLVAVSDNGIGIPENLQHTVFDSFITLGSQHISTSMGVGLHIVKHTMDLHHGYVTLDSLVGEGACFVLYILEGCAHFTEDDCDWIAYEPANEEVVEVVKAEPLPVDKSEKKSDNKQLLLIIEDNEDMRDYLCSLFREQYTVIEASDGKEGVDKAEEYVPQLIISDIMMPVMDGFECCKEIRENRKTCCIPIILLTAKTEDEDRIRGLRLGVDDFMMKPFNAEVLREKAKNLIEQRERLKLLYTKTLMLNSKPVKEEEKDDFMSGVIQIIESNLTNGNFGVKMLGDMLNMSQPTLYRRIKQSTDLSILEVIRGVRLSKAAALIMEQKYSLLDITEMVGFESVTVLRKHFVAQFGVLPSKYAKDK